VSEEMELSAIAAHDAHVKSWHPTNWECMFVNELDEEKSRPRLFGVCKSCPAL
jgi:hypothetical protein